MLPFFAAVNRLTLPNVGRTNRYNNRFGFGIVLTQFVSESWRSQLASGLASGPNLRENVPVTMSAEDELTFAF